MGIFDVFTGKPAREAAAANRKLYGDFNTGGNAIYDTAMPRAVSALEGGTAQARADIGAGYDAAGAAFGALADLYASDADKRAALLREMTAGVTGANTAEADAQIAASKTIWDTALKAGGIAKDAYGIYRRTAREPMPELPKDYAIRMGFASPTQRA